MVRKKPASKAKDLRAELYHGLILEAAEREFGEHGYELARMQRMADQAGLSVGTLYNLYPSKEALFVAVHMNRASALRTRLVMSLAGEGDALDRMGRALRAHIDFAVAHPAYLRVQLREGVSWASMPSQLPEGARATWEMGMDAGRALCAEGIADGSLIAHDPLLMVRTIIAIHQAHMAHWLDDDMREPADEVATRLLASLDRLYRSKPRARARRG